MILRDIVIAITVVDDCVCIADAHTTQKKNIATHVYRETCILTKMYREKGQTKN
jgi:hypothetical protein